MGVRQILPSGVRRIGNFTGRGWWFFYWVKRTWGGVILTIWIFLKAISRFLWILNTKIKSWPVSMKLKQRSCYYWVMTWKLLFGGGNYSWWGTNEQVFGWRGDSPVRKTLWCAIFWFTWSTIVAFMILQKLHVLGKSFSSYIRKCSQPIRLQDFISFNITKINWGIKFLFWM